MTKFFDLVIVGAGVAGLSALMATERHLRVAVVNPGSPLETGSSWRAQGGVAVALGRDDSPQLHATDTMKASRQMADLRAVEVLTQEGPERVVELLTGGLVVDKAEDGKTLFGLEAAHSRARVIHRKDHTGTALIGHLWKMAGRHDGAEFFQQRVTSLLTSDGGIGGVLLSDGTVLHTPRVILASGGFAGLYEATTTGREVRGDGIVLAAAAGARIRDLEFVQFHPTAHDVDTDGPLPLLTEALRGAGAVLRLEDGRRFVDELLPRDEVARAIAAQRAEGFTVYLDVNPVEELARRFPGAAVQLGKSERGFQGFLPVRPAAHYTIGGIYTDLNGLTTLPGLYACGEVASVGVHGANRLASNSLLEGLVFGHRAASHACATLRVWKRPNSVTPLARLEDPNQLALFRRKFEEATGVVRTAMGLSRFLSWLDTQPQTTESVLGRCVAQAALDRVESVGAHYRADTATGKTLNAAG